MKNRMIINYKVAFISLALLISNLTYAEDATTYLCIVEESTGFYFEKGKWGRAHFDVADDKYILRKLKDKEITNVLKGNTYGVFELGVKQPLYWCKSPTDYGKINCQSLVGEFIFSNRTGRFIKSYTVGYWDGVDNNNNTPNIARGRCSKI